MDMFIMLLAVLIHLGLISPSNGYWSTDIYAIEAAHQQEVDAIESDPIHYQAVQDDLYDDASLVVIYDRHENP